LLQTNALAFLVDLLAKSDSKEIILNATWALENMSFQEEARVKLREVGAMTALIQLLNRNDTEIQSQAAFALRNLSNSEYDAVVFCQNFGVESLMKHLSGQNENLLLQSLSLLSNLILFDAPRKLLVRMLDSKLLSSLISNHSPPVIEMAKRIQNILS